MKKNKAAFICQTCNATFSSWSGQCSTCGNWNTLVETLISAPKSGKHEYSGADLGLQVKQLSNVSITQSERITTGISELDRVLGGGFVPGQVVLLSGDPGIGKSTILTQMAKSMTDKNVLYICGEESPTQIKVRSSRMNYDGKNLFLLSQTCVDDIGSYLQANTGGSGNNYHIVIVDSIQTIYTSELAGLSGSIGQIREASSMVIQAAKNLSIPVILVGHVTKEGAIAGPKVLEHMVDTVLYLEGDYQHLFRILKANKNRFGSVSEIGVFEMRHDGMSQIKNPSELFLSERLDNSSGSCVSVVMEGTRPLLFEIQALTIPTAFGYPRRTASGFNVNRLNVLLAILEKRCGLSLSSSDVYLSIAGGYKVTEYSCDLAVCLAVASSLKGKALKNASIAFGECGLSGEVKKVTFQDIRVKEAKKLGFDVIISSDSVKTVKEAITKFLEV